MKTTFKDKFRYKFDNFISRGTPALIGGLGIVSLILIFVMALVVSVTGIAPSDGSPISFWEAAWLSLMRTLDAGTMGGDEGWSFRFAMFGVTLGGVFVISALIGTLTSGIESKMDELRKGRSRVIESGHTIILGWTPQIFTILSELILANENQTHACIVIMGDRDKVEMEDEIRTSIGNSGKTRIVCRSGNPMNVNDLEMVSLHTARSIIILAPQSQQPDTQTIKTMLAITNNASRRTEPYHIVAEIHDIQNLDAARLVGKDEVEFVLTSDLIARIVAQTCRQSGLSVVYTELLNFEGDEIYFKKEAALVGKTFREALLAYDSSTVLGIYQSTGTSRLNPPMDTILSPGDQIIAISEDDDTIQMNEIPHPLLQTDALCPPSEHVLATERTLILGWNHRGQRIVEELDHYTAPGSEVLLVANYDWNREDRELLAPQIGHNTITFQHADTTDRRILDSVHPETFNHVIVLPYADTLTQEEADAQTLITLLHLRDISTRTGHDLAIVSEMLDLQNRNLAEVTQADDFIVSDQIISLLLAQISENKALNAVFEDLFNTDGSEIYIKPASDFILPEKSVDFYTVVEAAARRGEVAFGYRLKKDAHDAKKSYGVVVNPRKSTQVTFAPGDSIIVLAEN